MLGSDRGAAFVESVVKCLSDMFGIKQVLEVLTTRRLKVLLSDLTENTPCFVALGSMLLSLTGKMTGIS